MFATIGYEKCKPEDFVATLQACRIDILIDIRERAQSRRVGFSKTALSKSVAEANIDYIHFRELGDPKAGRDAARQGKIEKFRGIFLEVLASKPAQEALSKIKLLMQSKRICFMCYERDYRLCHRKMVADHFEMLLGCEFVHLEVEQHEPRVSIGRVLHTREGAAA
mgnify:FL=1